MTWNEDRNARAAVPLEQTAERRKTQSQYRCGFQVERWLERIPNPSPERSTHPLEGGTVKRAERLERGTNSEPNLSELSDAAMRACDFHGDGADARGQMHQDCFNTPPHLRADLLEHFRQTCPPPTEKV